MCSDISLGKVDLVCAEIFKAKPIVNGSGFVTYLNIIHFCGVWLDNSGYLMTQWNFCVKQLAYSWFKKLGCKIGKIIAENNILTEQYKQIACIGYNKKRGLEMNPFKKKAEAQRLKAANMRMKKRINIYIRYRWKIMLEIITGKASKG